MRAGVAGSATQVAKVLSALGDEVRLCTLAGTDPAGLAVRADLLASGLSAAGVVDAGATSLGVVLVAPDGSRLGLPYTAMVNAVGYPAETFRRLAAGAGPRRVDPRPVRQAADQVRGADVRADRGRHPPCYRRE